MAMSSEEYRLKMSVGRMGNLNPNWGRHLGIKQKESISRANTGNRNGNWAGDKVGLCGLHEWVRIRLAKPEYCTVCGTNKTDDLCNRSGEYKRDLDDWVWMCRRCHMKSDGRMEKLNKIALARKELRITTTCPQCGNISSDPPSKLRRYCSKRCSNMGRAVIKRRQNANVRLVQTPDV